ncbi:acyltransferase family protein [Yersinia enterocolitica]|uniref:acyltransferase family protein n=1 Tax=Yersinia enterocolitica TaxID=630 RepID=UPI0005E6C560|nr:acyltransferase family protein [Yersinia enterocolitica]CNK71225.1 Fucose 4-O-acetylase and related acetyltransferases [Yersinia enterocolitica]CRY29751.1 Fucose 4-O-acetylase and related acetyltransferases [Yersinia enterocolitica]HDL7838451.1 acyltransferase family protein [Yersinia enterocolitica]
MENRNTNIDVLKAFATLLVIAGHVIQITTIKFDDSMLFKIIYSFHMPLFMCISGYLYKEPKVISLDIIKKAKLLLIPFFSWAVINYFLFNIDGFHIASFYSYMLDMLFNPSLGLWFLWVLFFTICIFISLPEKYKSIYVIIFIIIADRLQHKFSLLNDFGMGLLTWQFFFFFMGYCFRKYSVLSIIRNRYINILSLMIYISLVTQWHRLNVDTIFGLTIENSIINNRLLFIVRYATAISAIVFLFGLNYSYIYNKFKSLIIYISSNSLSFYAIQSGLIYFTVHIILNGITNHLIMQLICFLTVTVLAGIIIKIINHNNLLRTVLFGR